MTVLGVWILLALDLVVLASLRTAKQRYAWVLAQVIVLAALGAVA